MDVMILKYRKYSIWAFSASKLVNYSDFRDDLMLILLIIMLIITITIIIIMVITIIIVMITIMADFSRQIVLKSASQSH